MLAEMILTSGHFVAFTGAGISTSSGIPDYRSGFDTVLKTGPGAWESLANKKRFEQNQRKAAAAGGVKKAADANTVRSQIQKAYPSKTHMALLELFEKNHLKFIVSQNVDGLHRKSGIPAANIAELHGNTNLEVCEDCGREYMRDQRARTAKRTHDHRTGRKCESAGCNGHLKDTIINFSEPLNGDILQEGRANCANADVCLAMGSSLRVSPANAMPQACAQNGGQLVICNLQQTPLDHLAALVIHAKCDDVMEMLMQKLGYLIPKWQMKKRVEVSLVEQGAKIQLRGVDESRQPFHLFREMKVQKLAAADKVFPSQVQTKQPYRMTIPENRPQAFKLDLTFMGHYQEQNIVLDINLEELANAPGQSFMYEMVMDTQSGNWELVLQYDADRNMCGVASFTQHKAPVIPK